MADQLHPIQDAWIKQIRSADVSAFVQQFGDTRRVDITLFSDRGNTPKPPTLNATIDWNARVV